MNPLPCLVCGCELAHAILNDEQSSRRLRPNQPAFGIAFDSPGHYGSQVFDRLEGTDWLQIAVCDKCILEHADRTRVVTLIAEEKNLKLGRPIRKNS